MADNDAGRLAALEISHRYLEASLERLHKDLAGYVTKAEFQFYKLFTGFLITTVVGSVLGGIITFVIKQ